jgi:hypothetical protein
MRSYPFFPLALQPNAGQGLLMVEVSGSHTMTHHSRYDTSGRVIAPSQSPLPDNTQHSYDSQTSMPPVIFEPAISASDWPQTLALDSSATVIGDLIDI